jgi:type-F conjugative transfer system pilin assembly protein TrbC
MGKATNTAFQIDDTAFEKFDIKVVPTIVLSMENKILDNQTLKFDKVAGSISISQALTFFSNSGELSDIATNFLDDQDE